MRPILFKIGPIPFHSYGLMIAIGFLVALYFSKRDAKKAGYDPNVFDGAAFWVLLIGLAGTRLLHIIMFPEYYSWSDPVGWFAVWKGGLVFQGGPPLVLVFLYVYLKRHGIPFWSACDLVIPWVALGHAIGRLGCFIRGCCYGLPTEAPWGIRYPRLPADMSVPPTGSPAFLDHMRRFGDITAADHWSHAIHPTQLYSSLGLAGLCLALLYLRKHWNPFPGFTMPVYFVLYGVLRFVVEHFRGDHNPIRFGGLTDQQWFCILFALAGVALFFVLQRRAATSPEVS